MIRNLPQASKGSQWAWAGPVGLALLLVMAPVAHAGTCTSTIPDIEGKCWRVTHTLLTRASTTADALQVCHEDLKDAEDLLATPPEAPPSMFWPGVGIGAGAAAIFTVVLTLLAR